MCPTLGKEHSLECTITGTGCHFDYHDTTYNITWYKDGTKLLPDTDCLQLLNDKSAKCKFESLKYSHRGRYTCEVTITCGLVGAEPLKTTSNHVDVQLNGMLVL